LLYLLYLSSAVHCFIYCPLATLKSSVALQQFKAMNSTIEVQCKAMNSRVQFKSMKRTVDVQAKAANITIEVMYKAMNNTVDQRQFNQMNSIFDLSYIYSGSRKGYEHQLVSHFTPRHKAQYRNSVFTDVLRFTCEH
jgi:hypothetical protein